MHKATLATGEKDGPDSTGGKMGNALTAIKRYYSNNFLDAEKQYSINVFLGAYISAPDKKPHAWELEPEKPVFDVDKLYPCEVNPFDESLYLDSCW
jgi:hypothetical protein